MRGGPARFNLRFSFPGQNLNTAPLPSAPPSARIEPQGRPTRSRAARRRLYEIERNDPPPAAGKGADPGAGAQALGVSGPAVNKWERGACCPDLALLAPLARLLDTDLNTLLSFREELTGVEIAAFTEELYTLAQSGGIDAAFLRAEELLHRWPGATA